MKQIIQSFKTGQTLLEEVPAPIVSDGQVIIQTTRSLVSLGTEKMLVEFGKANLIQKARKQPEKVQQVLNKIKTEGLLPTLEAVFNKLEQPIPLGYCNVGRIAEVGKGVSQFNVGDRVISNGPHAEFVSVPSNLVAKVPDNVSDEEASFTVVGSIGLQAIRLLNPTFGEAVVVYGLGLIGLLTAQLLKANGCHVIGIDIDEDKLSMAQHLGIKTINADVEDVVKRVASETENIGADGVIITASAPTSEIISNSAKFSRKRGRIILVGVVGLDLNRSEFYEKELTFQVSCSYGPGRYDDDYEQKGMDYPLPFVRWTENRNFTAFLAALENRSVNVEPLITEKVPLEEFQKIYADLGKTSSIASLLVYDERPDSSKTLSLPEIKNNPGQKIAIVGAGNFTKMTLLPNFDTSTLKYIISQKGLNGKMLAKKYKIPYCSTDYSSVLQDDEVGLVILTTRHHLHAEMVIEAIKNNKDVFVEKPLALNQMELDAITDAIKKNPVSIGVGYNRRFSPHIQKIKSVLPHSAIKNMIVTMNAGHIPANSWIQDMALGGGRIVGEACHLFDLLIYLSGSRITRVCLNALGQNPQKNTDNASILLQFENGDSGTVHYFSNGSKAYAKERLELYFDEKTIVMDNFKSTRFYGVKGLSSFSTKLDKGHKAQFLSLLQAFREKSLPVVPFDEAINASKASFAALESLKKGTWVEL